MSIQPNPTAALWPAEWQGCRITGSFIDFFGAPLVGNITLTPSSGVVIAGTSKRVAFGGGLVFDLDANGAIDVIIPATDDADTNPAGWTYTVSEGWPGGRSYSLTAPSNGTVDLSSIVPDPNNAGGWIQTGV